MKVIKDSVHDHIQIDGVARDPARYARGTAPPEYQSARNRLACLSLGQPHPLRTQSRRLPSRLRSARASQRRREASRAGPRCGPAPRRGPRPLQPQPRVADLPANRPIPRRRSRTARGWDSRRGVTGTRSRAGYSGGSGRRRGAVRPGSFGRTRRRSNGLPGARRPPHGVPYGTIDHGRLVRELTFADGELSSSTRGTSRPPRACWSPGRS